MYVPFQSWLLAFLLTVAVEMPVVLLLLRGREPGMPRLAALVVFANLATHPIVWFVVPLLLYVATPEYYLAVETWAVLAEAVFYALVVRGLAPLSALGVSLTANIASFVVGLAVAELWPQLFS